MADKRSDNRTSDDLLADLDALDELLGPAWPISAPGGKSGRGTAGTPAQVPEPAGRRSEKPRESTNVAKKDDNSGSGPKQRHGQPSEEQIPLLEDVVFPGVGDKKAAFSPSPETNRPLPSRAEIDSWVEVAIEARLEPLKKQLRRELWEELLRRFPALRENGRVRR